MLATSTSFQSWPSTGGRRVRIVPPLPLVSLARSLLGQIAAGIGVDEQVQLADALGDRHQPEPLVAERRPARDAEQLPSRERAFDSLGKPKPPAAGKAEPHRAGAEAAERPLGALERGELARSGSEKCAMDGDHAKVGAHGREHRRQKLDVLARAERRPAMEPQLG